MENGTFRLGPCSWLCAFY